MYNVIAVTNRHLCPGDFLTQIAIIAQSGVSGILLREKDLDETQYSTLAKEVTAICQKYHTPCILHSFIDVAKTVKADAIHLPLSLAKERASELSFFETVGISTHSISDALCAERLGATYITAGHIFETDCKKGVPPRGLDFLKEVCASVSIPVYAIGGIHRENTQSALDAGAFGVCRMEWFMNASYNDMREYIQNKTLGK